MNWPLFLDWLVGIWITSIFVYASGWLFIAAFNRYWKFFPYSFKIICLRIKYGKKLHFQEPFMDIDGTLFKIVEVKK